MLHPAWVAMMYVQMLRARKRLKKRRGETVDFRYIPAGADARWVEGRIDLDVAKTHKHESKSCQSRIFDFIFSLNLLLVFVPVGIAMKYTGKSDLLQFIFAGLSIIPLAAIIGDCTEELAEKVGPGIGALVNAVFANATELILTFFALFKNLDGLVKGAFVGSIIGNQLLVLGLGLLLGGIKFKIQKFGQISSGQAATLSAFASVALVVPTIFHGLDITPHAEHELSIVVSVVMIATYTFSLVFQLFTHKSEYAGAEREEIRYGDDDGGGFQDVPLEEYPAATRTQKEETESGHRAGHPPAHYPHHHLLQHGGGAVPRHPHNNNNNATEEHYHLRPNWQLLLTLLITTGVVAIMSEIVTGAVETVGKKGGLSETFMGVIVLAAIGNAAEIAAIRLAMKNQLDVTLGITFGSALQIAMFSFPLCVLVSYARAEPLSLFLSTYEVSALIATALISWMVVTDGQSHWFEGLMMLMVYVIFAAGFYFIPSGDD